MDWMRCTHVVSHPSPPCLNTFGMDGIYHGVSVVYIHLHASILDIAMGCHDHVSSAMRVFLCHHFCMSCRRSSFPLSNHLFICCNVETRNKNMAISMQHCRGIRHLRALTNFSIRELMRNNVREIIWGSIGECWHISTSRLNVVEDVAHCNWYSK